MLLKTWQRCKNHTLAKLLQGFRQQVTWPTLLGILSRRIFGWQQQKVKNHQTFHSYLRANLLDEREKIRARSLQRLNYTSFLFVFFVILKCNSLSFLINPYFHTFSWPLQVLTFKKKFSISVLILSFFPGFRACFLYRNCTDYMLSYL